jgi:hypothetical protein
MPPAFPQRTDINLNGSPLMRINTSIPPEIVRLIKIKAKRENISDADVVRRALGSYFRCSADIKPYRTPVKLAGVDIPPGVVAG